MPKAKQLGDIGLVTMALTFYQDSSANPIRCSCTASSGRHPMSVLRNAKQIILHCKYCLRKVYDIPSTVIDYYIQNCGNAFFVTVKGHGLGGVYQVSNSDGINFYMHVHMPATDRSVFNTDYRRIPIKDCTVVEVDKNLCMLYNRLVTILGGPFDEL